MLESEMASQLQHVQLKTEHIVMGVSGVKDKVAQSDYLWSAGHEAVEPPAQRAVQT